MICTKCNENKPVTDFFWRSKIKGTRQSRCRTCWKKVRRVRYEKDGINARDKAKQNRINMRIWWRTVKADLKCEKCEFNHPAALDFHHIDPTTKTNKLDRGGAFKRGWSKQKILQEMKKCMVLCANCHRIEHYDAALTQRQCTGLPVQK